MRIVWSLAPGGFKEVPADCVPLPARFADDHVAHDELRLELCEPGELAALLRHTSPLGREILFQTLLEAIAAEGAWRQTRVAAMELVREFRYQPAIAVLTKVALSNHEADLHRAAPVLAELRADHSLVAIAEALPDRATFVLKQLHWTPTRTAHARLKRPPIRVVARHLDALDVAGRKWASSGRPSRASAQIAAASISLLAPSLLVRPRNAGALQDASLASTTICAREAARAAFDYLRALDEGMFVQPLDFGEQIVSIRDALLHERPGISPFERMDAITTIDSALGQAMAGLDLLRDLGVLLVREQPNATRP